MFAFNVDQEKVSHIPYTLKGWAHHHGAHTQLVALGYC